jgi:hypothetical protein
MGDDLIRKVEKLLALAGSANEHEARLAAAKAYELLHKHNAGLDAVERARRGYVSRVLWSGRRPPSEWRSCQVVLKRFFYVHPVRLGVPGMYVGVAVGSTVNTTIAEHVYHFLARTFRRSWADRRKRLGKRAGKRAALYRGLLVGVLHTLYEQAGGAFPPEDPALPAAAERMHGALGSGRKSPRVRTGNAYREGYHEGRRVRLHKAVEGHSENSGKALPAPT